MMKRKLAVAAALAAFTAAALAAPPKVASERTVHGFINPESVGCDPKGKAFYVGNFGAPKLDPASKDGMGYISKVSLEGKTIEDKFLPGPGGEKLHKPKGIWIQGDRLWVTDIDVVWIFDLKTKKGRKLDVPLGFANDPAIYDKALYVTDNRNDALIRIEPADFLDARVKPKITEVFKGAGVSPNGIYPGKGRLLMGGFLSATSPKAFWTIGKDGKPHPISLPLGRLDGLYQMTDGSILSTDWNRGAFFHWTMESGVTELGKGFKGPADLCAMPGAKGRLLVAVPDLVQSYVKIYELEAGK